MKNIIEKLKEADLRGRGGAGFPVYLKWESVLNAEGDKKYVICNGAEGELDVNKDKFILENYLNEVIDGINIALSFFNNSSAYIYLKDEYYDLLKDKFDENIIPFKEKGGYISGEETVLCNVIEGGVLRARKKPPFVSEKGLFNCPTLINNVETFYYVSKINKGEYNHERFYTVIGDIENPGVYELKDDDTIISILEKTNNIPNEDYYVQMGGGAIGEILLKEELDIPVKGMGFIRVISARTDPYSLMEKWSEFLMNGNCDRCTPCREGMYRIWEMSKKKELDFEKLDKIFEVLEKTSFCALGKGSPLAFRGLINKVIKK
jgi:NADH:ubiquinone oxidoreductase subunit F (NADH-binding)